MYMYIYIYIQGRSKVSEHLGFRDFFQANVFGLKSNTTNSEPLSMLYNDTKNSSNGSVLPTKSQKNRFFGLYFWLQKCKETFCVLVGKS